MNIIIWMKADSYNQSWNKLYKLTSMTVHTPNNGYQFYYLQRKTL